MKFDLTIRRNFDVEHKPKVDRLLPSHPMNVKGHLPYWYLRTRFTQYGLADYDLPLRGITRNPDHGEALFILNSKIDALGTTYYGLGAILPYHELFFRAMWEIDFSQDELIKGDKIDPDAPWAFRYFDDIPVVLTSGNHRFTITFNSVNGYGSAKAEIYSNINSSVGSLVVSSQTLTKDFNIFNFTINGGNYILRVTTGSKYSYKLEKL